MRLRMPDSVGRVEERGSGRLSKRDVEVGNCEPLELRTSPFLG